jgi:pilus assembly protein CpaC
MLLLAPTALLGAEEYRIGTSDSRILTFTRPVESILVRHPDVLSVKVLTSRELLMTGQRGGRTELTVWHSDGTRQSIAVNVDGQSPAQARQREQLESLVRQLDPGQQVQVELYDDNRVALSGVVPNATRGQRLEALTEAMGFKPVNLLSVEGSQQVQLFVRVAEVVRGNPLRSGAVFFDKRDRYGVLPPGGGNSTNFLLDLEGAMASAALPVPHSDAFVLPINPNKASLFGLLNLLEAHNLARVLAQPTLVVESGKTARFLAGGEVPIPIAQDNNTVTVDYKKFGVMLEFTPRILDDNIISMDVEPEVSNIDETAGITLGSIQIPGFRTRRTQTTVRVSDGESFVVGGLLQDEIRSAVQKVPLFGDIPILGALFRSSAYEKNQSELAIIVTPRIVRPIPAGEAIPLPGENLDRPSTAEAILLGKVVVDSGRPARYPLDQTGLEMPQ